MIIAYRTTEGIYERIQLNARRHGLTSAVASRRSLASAVVKLNEYFCAVTMHCLADKLKALDLAAVLYAELESTNVKPTKEDEG